MLMKCAQCGKEIIGVESAYTDEWLCSKCGRNESIYNPIYCEKGDRIVFINYNGSEYDLKKAQQYLNEGQYYTVNKIDIGSWCSDIYLEEFPDINFNSVMFKRSTLGLRRERINCEESAMISDILRGTIE
jgi:hypothetical protein